MEIIRQTAAGHLEAWVPSTLDRLGKLEKDLEDVLASHPGLLQVESVRTGIRGPFSVFRQLSFSTPQGRSIAPDITLMAASGHPVIVEVKRFVNPELRDRQVIVQVVDYAASFAALSEAETLELFAGGTSFRSWPEFVQSLFPDEPEVEELAHELLARLRSGRIHLVIACDKAPTGLEELIRGVSVQSSLEVTLDLVEVTPYVLRHAPEGEILFVPRTRLQTEIVARTAVTVIYRQGDAQPQVQVQTTSLEEIEENVEAAATGTPRPGRTWTVEEVEQAILDAGDPRELDLFRFAQDVAVGGRVLPKSKTLRPGYGPYVSTVSPDGQRRDSMLFGRTLGDRYVYLRQDTVRCGGEGLVAQFIDRVSQDFGIAIDSASRTYISVPYAVVSQKMELFKALVSWLQEALTGS